jgi:hypothetical protein
VEFEWGCGKSACLSMFQLVSRPVWTGLVWSGPPSLFTSLQVFLSTLTLPPLPSSRAPHPFYHPTHTCRDRTRVASHRAISKRCSCGATTSRPIDHIT